MTVQKNLPSYVFGFTEAGGTSAAMAGGKGANLGALSRISELRVPDGFCISTEAFERVVRQDPATVRLLDRLSLLKKEEGKKIRELSGEIRGNIESIGIPEEIEEAIGRRLSALGEADAYAVRSSATAEDLTDASFAGQQDSYLNITGKEAILAHVSKCWASLFAERAVIYRLQNGFGHHALSLAVVVQKMVIPQASGVLFTADPLSGNRKILSIDAVFGLGEALVSGRTNADNYKVRSSKITGKTIARKKLALRALKDGGTAEQEIAPERQYRQVLSDKQVLRLARTGRKIEAHFGRPQDIEWCLRDDEFYIVQSRPVTTLYPVPETDDEKNHVYVSVGHQQMMTDAIKPLGLSFWEMTALRPFSKAGGRLFVDVSPILASPDGREKIMGALGKSDPLIKDALTTIMERKGFIETAPAGKKQQDTGESGSAAALPDFQAKAEYDPTIVEELTARGEKAIETLRHAISTRSGPALFDFIQEDMQRLRKLLSDPLSFPVIMTGMNASSWINDKMNEWLGEKGLADTLSQSAPGNITSEMGLALLEVADAIRPYPEIIEQLESGQADDFPDDLLRFRGGEQVRQTIRGYLGKYGMRCAGEIDITRTRWSEKPSVLIPLLLGNIKNFPPGAGKRKFEQGLREARQKEEELLRRLKELPDGREKTRETKQMIRLLRNFIGYREYPKYVMVSHYFIYKQALMKEAGRLVHAGVIREKEDVYYLSFEEFRKAVSTKKLDYDLIRNRKEDYKHYQKLTPPRVFTSEGEIITGAYEKEDIPPGAMAGLPVSAGIAEGRARVILKMEDARLEEGDILVTSFTDPSWTPLFLSIKALVTEVGGLMTHGAVIAREYGLPAVVGIDNATKLIKDGQRIRVHGTEGYVEILGE